MKTPVLSCAIILTLSLAALNAVYADSATWSMNPISSDRAAEATAGSILHMEFSYSYFFVSLCERTLNVRGFPVREGGQVAWLESPNGLSASKTLKESHLLVNTTLVIRRRPTRLCLWAAQFPQ